MKQFETIAAFHCVTGPSEGVELATKKMPLEGLRVGI
jgi:hypothetical protein